MIGQAVLLALALAVCAGVAYGLRGKWDLVAAHLRDGVRHFLAGLLMLGTLAGTIWTFSNGALSVSGIWESIISVGGVAAALELGVIYCGIHIGELDQRIHTARKADVRESLTAERNSLMRWFYGVAAMSAIANYLFRSQQLHDYFQAILPAAAPIFLVILFTIKLRPLPRDYAEIGRQATQRGLVMIATQAQNVMMRSLRQIGQGRMLSEQEQAQLAMAVALIRVHTSGEQQQALDHVIAQQTQAQLPSGYAGGYASVGGGDAGEWLDSAAVASLYDISERTAQSWISQAPGRRQKAHSRGFEARASVIYAAHGVPKNQNQPAPARRRRRSQPQEAVTDLPFGADDVQIVEADPPTIVNEVPTPVLQTL